MGPALPTPKLEEEPNVKPTTDNEEPVSLFCR
jgi:hypothetical protein